MKAAGVPFRIAESDLRIRSIVEKSDHDFGEADEIPPISALTYENGFGIDCTALFIDIRGSSKLADKHNRPTLGKMYRAYISECVAVIGQDKNCGSIFIQGDCVGSVFHARTQSEVQSVFARALQLNALIDLLNWRFRQHKYSEIQCGIGISKGRALMMRAGYAGSRVTDVIWMGKVVNDAAKLCHAGSRAGRMPVQIAPEVHELLDDAQRAECKSVTGWDTFFDPPKAYETNLKDPDLANWLQKKQQESNEQAARLAKSRWL